jgi:hypothetical protein
MTNRLEDFFGLFDVRHKTWHEHLTEVTKDGLENMNEHEFRWFSSKILVRLTISDSYKLKSHY